MTAERIVQLRAIWDRYDTAENQTEEQDEASDAFDAVFLNGSGMAELFDAIDVLQKKLSAIGNLVRAGNGYTAAYDLERDIKAVLDA